MSEDELVQCLEEIRAEVRVIVTKRIDNTVFLTLDGFYSYFDHLVHLATGLPSRLPELLSKIEPYIVPSISDKEMGLYIRAIVNADDSTLDKIEANYEKSAKIGFINEVYAARNADEWAGVIKKCLYVREAKMEATDCD